MSSQTRFSKIGLSGKTAGSLNILDSFAKTYEIPITSVSSSSVQSTNIEPPTGAFAVMGAFLYVEQPETVAVTKTIDLGTLSDITFLGNNIDVSTAGAKALVPTGVSASTDFAYQLAGSDFADLEATLVVCVIGFNL